MVEKSKEGCGNCAAHRKSEHDAKGLTVLCALNPPALIFMGMQQAPGSLLAGKGAGVTPIIQAMRPLMDAAEKGCEQWRPEAARAQ